MDVRAGDPEYNLACVADWTAEAARRGSDLVVFPELWDSGYALDRAADIGSPVDAGRFSYIAALARTHAIHILGSMMEVTSDGRAFNSAVWFTPDGPLDTVYRKTHLFRLMDEEKYLQPGSQLVVHDLPWGRTGVAICYDLRFPELFRGYALAGASLTIIPAEWPAVRIAHWRTLLRARAIENQMIVVGCNRTGYDGEQKFGGRSALLDAWGEPVIEGGDHPVLLTGSIDISSVSQVRSKIPIFEDRRPDLYISD
jgi:predicted amidohydrolase